MTFLGFPTGTPAHRKLTPAEEVLVQRAARVLVTPDLSTMRKVCAAINDAFDRVRKPAS